MLEYWHYNNVAEESRDDQENHFRKIIKSAFNIYTAQVIEKQ
mgnify:CR=1 FL=1